MENKPKTAYFQWLRVFAAAAVVIMHTAAKGWNSAPADSGTWLTLTVWESLVRWPVPVFVMITGALFLPRKTDLKQVLTRYIPRMAAVWAVWSLIHALQGGGDVLKTFLAGHYHLWYLPFLCGVYLTIPFLQRIAGDDALTGQLLKVSTVISIGIPWLADALALVPGLEGYVRTVENQLHFTFFFDLLPLLLLGHWLNSHELAPKHRHLLYGLGLLGLAVTAPGTVWVSRWAGRNVTLFFDQAAPNVLLSAAALFVFARYHLKQLPKWVDFLAKCSFGIYLSHALVIEILEKHAISTVVLNPLWSVPVLSFAVFSVAALFTAAVRNLPGIGKIVT